MYPYRRPGDDACQDDDDEVVSYEELTEPEDPDALEPIDILIAQEEEELRRKLLNRFSGDDA